MGRLRTLEPLRLRFLLSNDDGFRAPGLITMARHLKEIGDVTVVAPDRNRSGASNSLTLDNPIRLHAEAVDVYAVEGTPTDCVHLAITGLLDDEPDMVVSGINHGANLGDDITYSGTVAAALEGVVLGVPAIAVYQQANHGEMDFRAGSAWGHEDFEQVAQVVARMVESLDDVPMPPGTLLNVNAPAGRAQGVCACRQGKRDYGDRMELTEEEGGRRRYRIYSEAPGYHDEEGTDFAAIGNNEISVTPVHLELTDDASLQELCSWGVESLLEDGLK
jgi:5'-nucleotidase